MRVVDSFHGAAWQCSFANQISRFAMETKHVVGGALCLGTGLYSSSLVSVLAGILFLATFLTAAAAPELIDALLGPSWSGLAVLLRILLPISILQVIAVRTGPILLAIDRLEPFFGCSSDHGSVLPVS